MRPRLDIYLDDSADSDRLIPFLTRAEHKVVSPRVVGTSRARDTEHLEYATSRGCVMLTFDGEDFLELHEEWKNQGKSHAGILAVYFDNNTRRDAKPHDLLRAIDNLLASGIPLVNEFHILNQ